MNDDTRKQLLVIGVGNDYRGDDSAGLRVARLLRPLLPPAADVEEITSGGAAVMEAWSAYERVFLVDAVSSGSAPGTIFRFEPVLKAIPAKIFHHTTHDFSVAEAIELSRTLGRLPGELVVYGIEGRTFSAGAEISPVVEEAAQEVARRILQEIGEE